MKITDSLANFGQRGVLVKVMHEDGSIEWICIEDLIFNLLL